LLGCKDKPFIGWFCKASDFLFCPGACLLIKRSTFGSISTDFMTKLTLFLVFTFSVLSSYAQDTLVKWSGEKILCKVLLIGDQVQFKKSERPNGPTYTENISVVKYIAYSNGMVDKDFGPAPATPPAQQPAVAQPTPVQVVPAPVVPSPPEKITEEGSKMIYRNRTLSERKLLKMAGMECSKEEMKSEIKKEKEARKEQYTMGIAGGACGVGVLVTGYIGIYAVSFDSNALTPVLSIAAVFLAGTVALEVASIVMKHRRKAHLHQVMDIYNSCW
jgi:hypothetical protein